MAPNARPVGLPSAPTGQLASGPAAPEPDVNLSEDDPTLPIPSSSLAVVAPDPPQDQDKYPGAGIDLHNSEDANQPPGWPAPPPAVRADGWDADSTAAWDPASAWEVEDTHGVDASGLRDEAPEWEGEIVTWEAQPPASLPAPLVGNELTGAETYPPGYVPEHLPAHLSSGEEALAVYTGRQASPAPPGRFAYDRKGRHLARRENGPWRELVIITAVAVIVSAAILAVTTAEKNNIAGLNNIFGSPTTTPRVVSTSSPTFTAGAATPHSAQLSPTSPNSVTASSVAAKNATPATLSQQAKSLPVTPGVAQSLVKSWLATNPGGYGIGPSDVAGTVPHEVYYAVQRATGTYWAVAAFKPSPALLAQSSTQTGQEELAQFHDSVYAFSWQAGPVWTLLGEFNTGNCPDVWVPRSVLASWGLCGL
jgi:hypothetical protein